MASTRFLKISAAITGVGLAGLLVGFVLFPDSNLLGGLGLIFGPVYWLGMVLLVIAALIWTLGAVRRRLAARSDRSAPEDASSAHDTMTEETV